jgi:hypothetical protein
MRLRIIQTSKFLLVLVLGFISLYLTMNFTRYAPYEPKRIALASDLGISFTTQWDSIKYHLDCELLKDGITRADLKQRLRPFEPYYWREFGFRNDSLDGDVFIEFEGLPIEDRYYSFRDENLMERSYVSGLDLITIQCAK